MPRTEALSVFSIPVFTGLLDGLVERREALVRAIQTLRSSSPGIVASNCHGWHSERTLQWSTDPDIAWLLLGVRNLGRAMLTGTDPRAERFIIAESWAMVLEAGGWSTPHQHFPAAWSGVVYLSAEQEPTEAADRSGKLELMNPIPLAERFGQANGVVIGPKDGLVVLFPGALSHFVHPVRQGGARISVSFNLALPATSGALGSSR